MSLLPAATLRWRLELDLLSLARLGPALLIGVLATISGEASTVDLIGSSSSRAGGSGGSGGGGGGGSGSGSGGGGSGSGGG